MTQKRNYPLLHQNGTVFWLKRNLDLLPTEGRPLSQQNKLADMYALRQPQYESFADFIVENNDTVQETIRSILSSLEGFL